MSDRKEAIASARVTIYDHVADLVYPSDELERTLGYGLIGQSFFGLPLRTRSKRVKELVATTLGYPAPVTFRKCQPRFPGQDLDVYVQKSNNLQIWNEEVSPTRRYALVRLDANSVVTEVRVVTGAEIAKLDTTGTLTKKYQARMEVGRVSFEQVSSSDTLPMRDHVSTALAPGATPLDMPYSGQILSIGVLAQQLQSIVGTSFPDAGVDQERLRGAALHALVCTALGYRKYADGGSFPDVLHQLLEVKLQTSPTIDLGLVEPSSEALLPGILLGGTPVRVRDVRYAIFAATSSAGMVTITHAILVTGEDFFRRLPRFGGNVVNAKLQIPLPSGFFRS